MAKQLVQFKNIHPEEAIPATMTRPDAVRRLSKVQEFQIGSGAKVWRADRQGMWLGAKKFDDAPFSVDMEGNVIGLSFSGTTINSATITGGTISGASMSSNTFTGGTITGALFRTAASGVRIEIDSPNDQNEVRFYEDDSLYATLLVRKDGTDGLIEIVDPNGAGFRLTSGVGASSAGSAELVSAGGTISTAGNATTGWAQLTGNGDKYIGMFHSAGGDANVITNALPTSDPGVTNALWNDSGTVKISSGP